MRAVAAALSLVIALAGCGGPDTEKPGVPGMVRGFGGGIVADEPRAATIGVDILSAGGSAADAAVAVYFALAVTYPSAAGIGGGGVCLVHDPDKSNAIPELLEFPRVAPRDGGSVAIPGNIRGMGVLHAKYGKMRWENVVTPGEQLARTGFPVSRAYVRALEEVAGVIGSEPDMADYIYGPDRQPRQEGQPMRQDGVGTVLAAIRAGGAGEFYVGQTSRRFIEAANAKGGRLNAEEMRSTGPRWTEATRIEVPGDRAMFVPAGPVGAIATQLWQAVAPGGAGVNDRLIAALGRAYGVEGAPAPLASVGSTGFVTLDRAGRAVACAVSMGQPFGIKSAAAGVLMSAPPSDNGDEGRFLSPAVVTSVRRGDYQVYAVAAGSGGETAPAATIEVLGQFLIQRQTPAAAVAAPRLFRPSPTGALMFEPGAEVGFQGFVTREVPALGRVELIGCPNGASSSPGTCTFAADRRGFGLADGGQM